MKLIAIILSFGIFAMALTPCNDALVHTDCAVETTHNHEEGEDEEDGCTPFCSCDCCSVSVTIPTFDAENSLEFCAANFEYNFFYSFQYSFDFLKGVWRPPNFC